MTAITDAAINEVRAQIRDLARATEGRWAKAATLCWALGEGDGLLYQQIVGESNPALIAMWIEAVTGAKLAASHAGRMT